MSQAELQQDVQRVAMAFMDRVAQAGDALAVDAQEPARTRALLQQVLLYNSAALDIASGPHPAINVLDMLVFTTLCRTVLERHWIPGTLGQDGEALLAAFASTEPELWEVAAKILDAGQQADVRESIAAWQVEHADQFRVEGVRFLEFSEHVGTASRERAERTRGLLGQVRSATRSADQALLIGERAMFVMHRMPFLIRLQTRIGAQDVLSDSLVRLHSAAGLVRRWSVYVLLASLGWALFFWAGYCVAR